MNSIENHPKHRAKFHASGGPDLGVKNQNLGLLQSIKAITTF
jgi:hypothetical protein